jgi:hypothetical protein
MRYLIGHFYSTLAEALVTLNCAHFLFGAFVLITLFRPASSIDSKHTWLPDNTMRILMNSLGSDPSFGQGRESNTVHSENINNIRSWELVNAVDT